MSYILFLFRASLTELQIKVPSVTTANMLKEMSLDEDCLGVSVLSLQVVMNEKETIQLDQWFSIVLGSGHSLKNAST